MLFVPSPPAFSLTFSRSDRASYTLRGKLLHDDLVTALCLAVLWPHRYAECSRIGFDGIRYVRAESAWGR